VGLRRPLARLDLLLEGPLAAERVAHEQGGEAKREPGVAIEEARELSAPGRNGQDRLGLVNQLNGALGDLLGHQHHPGEGERVVRIVELVVDHRRPHPIGADAGDVDPAQAIAAEVGGGAEAERDRGVLAGRVSDDPGGRRESGQGDQVDDVAAAARAHLLDRREGPVHGPHGVHLEHPAVDVDRLLVGDPGVQDPGVVHPDVQGAASFDDLVRRGIDRLRVADVQDQRPGAFAELLGDSADAGLVNVGHGDVISAPHEPPGDLQAHPSSRSGDQCRRHRPSIWRWAIPFAAKVRG
jgi:hypothetical protein